MNSRNIFLVVFIVLAVLLDYPFPFNELFLLSGLIEAIAITGVFYIIYFFATKMRGGKTAVKGRTAGKGKITYGVINEDGTITDHSIDKTKLIIMGKWVTIPHSKDEQYIVIQDHEHLILRKGLLYCEYFAHDPYPRAFTKKETEGSANEVKEIADTKVWKDVLTLSLTDQIGQTQIILFAIIIVMTVVNLYLTYSVNSQVGQMNNLLGQVVHYLFPNSTPA